MYHTVQSTVDSNFINSLGTRTNCFYNHGVSFFSEAINQFTSTFILDQKLLLHNKWSVLILFLHISGVYTVRYLYHH